MKRILTALLLVFAAPFIAAADLDGDAVLKNVDDGANAFTDFSFQMTMTTVDKSDNKKIRVAKVRQKGRQRLVLFTSPASERGLASLTMADDTVYVYLPAFRKTRRIAAHVRNQTFLGTDFSYEDMASAHYGKDYAAKKIGETDQGWTLELTPRPGAKVGYSRLEVFVKKEPVSIGRIDYFDDKGEKMKSEVRSEHKVYDKGYICAHKVVMTTLKDNHYTTLELVEPKYDQGLKDEVFTQRTLKRGLR
jgi:outer membrane lipoprotein-sorting protein